jgi:hypothetical protein
MLYIIAIYTLNLDLYDFLQKMKNLMNTYTCLVRLEAFKSWNIMQNISFKWPSNGCVLITYS